MVTELISRDPHSSGGRGMVTGGGRGGAGICGVRRRRGRSGVHLQRSPPPSDLWAGTHHGVHSQILFLRVTFCSTPRRWALLTWKTILPSKTQTEKKWVIGTLGQGTCAQCLRSDHKSNSSRRGAYTCAWGRGGGCGKMSEYKIDPSWSLHGNKITALVFFRRVGVEVKTVFLQ